MASSSDSDGNDENDRSAEEDRTDNGDAKGEYEDDAALGCSVPDKSVI